MLKKKNYGEIIEFKAARTILGQPIYVTHFFYLNGLLIDTGPDCKSMEIISALKKLPVENVVITHQHEDHTGNCSLIKKELGVPIYAHPGALDIMANPPDIEIYRKVMWGNAPPVEAKPLPAAVQAGHYTLDVIHTGGHSGDHVCFFEPQNRWLFTGDIYLGESLTGFMIGENIVEHLTGLKKMIGLKPNLLFCGLKGRLENATQRLAGKYNYWWDLCSRVKDLYNAGKSRQHIMSEAFGGEIFFYYFSQSNWGRRYMLDSIIENLDYLDSEQKKNPLRDM